MPVSVGAKRARTIRRDPGRGRVAGLGQGFRLLTGQPDIRGPSDHELMEDAGNNVVARRKIGKHGVRDLRSLLWRNAGTRQELGRRARIGVEKQVLDRQCGSIAGLACKEWSNWQAGRAYADDPVVIANDDDRTRRAVVDRERICPGLERVFD